MYLHVHFKCVILEAKSYAGCTVIKGMKGWLKYIAFNLSIEITKQSSQTKQFVHKGKNSLPIWLGKV